MEKRVFIIGHRNPDTDSVVSAAAYAALKQAQGMQYCRAARAGKISPQTEYIFERFGVPIPEYLPDLIPKAAYYVGEPPVTISAEVSVWEALELMHREGHRVLPIVDRNGVYQSMFHYRGFSQYIITHINPHKKSNFPVSIHHLVRLLGAEPITLFNAEEVQMSPIVVAAASFTFFKAHLETGWPEDCLVIVGDRRDIQRHCIEQKVRALILSNGLSLDKELTVLAERNQVSVISSPYDTSSTAMLIIYSTPVGFVGDHTVPLMKLSDPIRKIREPLSRAPSRYLPIGDDAGRVAGLIFEGDLIREPNIEVIMVDHNEPSQAIEGIENYRVLEVIDHHRLGNLSTRYPITFINRVVGATCTIITGLYREQRVPLEKNIASILLCGILADTLALQSTTTTDTDREATEYLASITGLDLKVLGQELQTAANAVNSRPAEELIALDMKEYAEHCAQFSVSQIETDNPASLVSRKEEIIAALEKVCAAKDYLFASLLVTDVTILDSLLFVAGKKSFTDQIRFPLMDERIYSLPGVVSRKKQLMPLLSELVEKAEG
ncbi:MAG: putative manganese-dependent inorganic diphosphatase [Treponema sp.]|jgi:manganese-dependent inorganic pyrophosphatase|nr:putative manganese-dependent inorganic diphosphatase [Treponema sp.]